MNSVIAMLNLLQNFKYRVAITDLTAQCVLHEMHIGTEAERKGWGRRRGKEGGEGGEESE